MPRTIEISYLEDNTIERKLAESTAKRIAELGGLSIMTALYFDEYGADGLTPRIEFPDGTVVDGVPGVQKALEEDLLPDYVASANS
ncbi:MAG TPA: hypothetical protein PK265_03015 [Candidatus Saccharibacteria bacterium]|nr:hypothetical protein [Candidatus Saccharibacteria bacterium]